MKTLTRFLTVLLLAGSCFVFAQKLPKRETVYLPRGRSITVQARVNKLGHAYGTVTVDFKMNRKGEVTWADANALHTTVMDKSFVRKVVNAVRNMKFNKVKHAPMSQKGSISYSFR